RRRELDRLNRFERLNLRRRRRRNRWWRWRWWRRRWWRRRWWRRRWWWWWWRRGGRRLGNRSGRWPGGGRLKWGGLDPRQLVRPERGTAPTGQQLLYAVDHLSRFERLDQNAVAPTRARFVLVDRLERAGQ